MKKKSLPHIQLKNKGPVDLFFEFLDIPDRKKLIEDIQKGEEINLPDFGHIGETIDIDNKVKNMKEDDIRKIDEEFIMKFLNPKSSPKHPILQYDNQQHKYKLKPKYDIEQMLKQIYTKHI